ncbi:hypothetical protein [Actinomadura rupiterrae]|uniref:hypothetical protein n=1 Tax=Actinomadura rupiterrae TaxID=559627 RepID=UPI0020A368B9|nr:hypothetical protein [Actinomadura rupiterrae]MCP2342538.1 hypothetical protein [Actinomadura rupiterrae]
MSDTGLRSESFVALDNVLSSCRLGIDGSPSPNFQITDLPLHLGRIVQHPGGSAILHDREEIRLAIRGLDYTDESWAELSYGYGDHPTFDESLERELRERFGDSVPAAFAGLRELLIQAETCTLVDATHLPYAGEFGRLFPAFRDLASAWLLHAHRQNSADETEPSSSEIIQATVLTEDIPYGHRRDRDWLTTAVGTFYEMRATFKNDQELGLPMEKAPSIGWLRWFEVAAEGMTAKLRSDHDIAGQLVMPAHGSPTLPHQGADHRFGNVTALAAALDGRLFIDGSEGPTTDALRRFKRALAHSRFYYEPETVIKELQTLAADSVSNPRLINDVLGDVAIPSGVERSDALLSLATQLSEPYPAPRRPSLTELPMSGWELRFRFPVLVEFAKARPEAPDGIQVREVAAAYEPCRVGLPPLVGEIAELVALLPDDEDVDRAMAHLGATGTGWRPILERMVAELTAHIWAHEEERNG